MKTCSISLSTIVGAVALIGMLSVSHSEEAKKKVDKPTAVVDSVRQSDPPTVSTTTKPSPVNQKATDYHPTPTTSKPLDKVVVPLPPK